MSINLIILIKYITITVGAMKEDIMPYFDQILQVLRQYLSNHNPPEEEIQLQVEALGNIDLYIKNNFM